MKKHENAAPPLTTKASEFFPATDGACESFQVKVGEANRRGDPILKCRRCQRIRLAHPHAIADVEMISGVPKTDAERRRLAQVPPQPYVSPLRSRPCEAVYADLPALMNAGRWQEATMLLIAKVDSLYRSQGRTP